MTYQKPNITLLPDSPEQAVNSVDKHQIEFLEKQLKQFDVPAKVVNVVEGQIVTLYELELGKGVKSKQFKALSDDLAMALKAKNVRLLTPVPGKQVVGIEVPNKNKHIVYIKDVMQKGNFSAKPNEIKLALGNDTVGNPRFIDLTRAPHLLMAGQTGSGKSVAVNAMLASILMTKTPDELKLLLIDPKMVELIPYNSVPHLLTPVITDPDGAVKALKWAVDEMDRRYSVLAEMCAKNIDAFNEKSEKKMFYIVIIIDEFSDLMMTSGKEVEDYVMRITQKARAVGIHLILTTQRPSTDVVTGVIKANLPTRIGFQTSSYIDSQTIMDRAGCERLIGNGDMLLKTVEASELERIHGVYITENETEKIIEVWEAQKNEKSDDFIQTEEIEPENDPRLDEALEIIKHYGRASQSLIQRHMEISWDRAKNIMDYIKFTGQMEKL